jgi:tRNA1(Val) A37 N6-methylase TrmN6
VIVQVWKDAFPATVLLAGLVLHADDQRYTPEAERVLREGAPLILVDA